MEACRRPAVTPAVVLLLALAAGTARGGQGSSPTALSRMAGGWEGKWWQDNGAAGTLALDLRRQAGVGSVVGTIDYDDGDCRTELTRVAGPKGEVWARERVIEGYCISEGTFQFQLQESGELRFRWWYPDDGHEGAWGLLHRRDAPKRRDTPNS